MALADINYAQQMENHYSELGGMVSDAHANVMDALGVAETDYNGLKATIEAHLQHLEEGLMAPSMAAASFGVFRSTYKKYMAGRKKGGNEDEKGEAEDEGEEADTGPQAGQGANDADANPSETFGSEADADPQADLATGEEGADTGVDIGGEAGIQLTDMSVAGTGGLTQTSLVDGGDPVPVSDAPAQTGGETEAAQEDRLFGEDDTDIFAAPEEETLAPEDLLPEGAGGVANEITDTPVLTAQSGGDISALGSSANPMTADEVSQLTLPETSESGFLDSLAPLREAMGLNNAQAPEAAEAGTEGAQEAAAQAPVAETSFGASGATPVSSAEAQTTVGSNTENAAASGVNSGSAGEPATEGAEEAANAGAESGGLDALGGAAVDAGGTVGGITEAVSNVASGASAAASAAGGAAADAAGAAGAAAAGAGEAVGAGLLETVGAALGPVGILAGVGIGLADLFGAFKPHTKEQDPAEQPPAQGTLTGVSTYGQQVATNTMMMTAGAS